MNAIVHKCKCSYCLIAFPPQVRHNLMDVSEKLNDENPKLLVIYKIQKLKQ